MAGQGPEKAVVGLIGRWAIAAIGVLGLGIIGTAVTAWARIGRLEDQLAGVVADADQLRLDLRDHDAAQARTEAEWRAVVQAQALTVRGLETEAANIRRLLDDQLLPLLRRRR